MRRGERSAPPALIHHQLRTWIEYLEREVLAELDRLGGTRGPVRPRQRPWSYMLDVVEHEQQALALRASRLGHATPVAEPRKAAA